MNTMASIVASEVEIDGNKILVDLGIIDLVRWMNAFPGVETFTSCQGKSACCRPEAFVGFTSSDPDKPDEIRESLGFGQLLELENTYELSFDVPELVALNQKHIAESQHWKDAFPDVVEPDAEIQ